MTAAAATDRVARRDRGTRLLVADVGRTTCRVARGDGAVTAVPSGASLADRDGPATILAALEAAAGDTDPDSVDAVAVGAAGAAQASPRVTRFAEALRDRFRHARVTVTSDVVTAHLGALEGGAGVVAIAGTGAVALAVGADGRHHLVDGHGPYLGDAGSGTWIGRRALDAALRHHDGRPGGSAALARAATARYGALSGLPGVVHGAASPWRDVAAFVPDVAAAADGGDPVALGVLADAVAELAATTRTAARAVAGSQTSGTPVPATLVGGLADLVTHVREPLRVALAHADQEVRLVAPAGDALAGARRLAEDGPGVHHHLVLQLPARSPRTAARPADTRIGRT